MFYIVSYASRACYRLKSKLIQFSWLVCYAVWWMTWKLWQSTWLDFLNVIDLVNERLWSCHRFLIIPSFLLPTWNSQLSIFLRFRVLLDNVTGNLGGTRMHTHPHAYTLSSLCSEACGCPVKAVPDEVKGVGADMWKCCFLGRVIAMKTDKHLKAAMLQMGHFGETAD